jgi:hypothetical protein
MRRVAADDGILESGQAQDARCIGGGWVGAELASEPSLERLGIAEREPFDLSDDLELSGRRVEDAVGLRRVWQLATQRVNHEANRDRDLADDARREDAQGGGRHRGRRVRSFDG